MASNSIITYKVTCATANTAYNVLTGTTSAPSTTAAGSYLNKGHGITFQCQTSGSIGKVGGTDVVTNAGILIYGPNGAYTPPDGQGSSAYQAQDWWVSADVNGTVIVVQIVKHV